MQASDFLLNLLLILVSARVLGEIARYFNAPNVIGELCAGILIGPSMLCLITMDSMTSQLGEIGVILLLFGVGLETDMGKMIETGYKSAMVAIGGFLAPFVLGFVVCYYLFNTSMLIALFCGGTLTATSIGITARTLMDLRLQNSQEGQITIGAAVLDDILGVVLLALLYEFSVTGSVNLLNTTRVLLFIVLFFLVAPVLARLFSSFIQRLYRFDPAPGLIPTTIVSLVLFFAWLAHVLGAPELLGGFAAGLALSRRFFLPFGLHLQTVPDFSEHIHREMTPVIHLFTPIFFVSVGLGLDLRDVDWLSVSFWLFSLTMLGVAIFSKFAGALLIREPLVRRIVIGMSMVPRGEVGLVFAGLGMSAGVFTRDIYTALIMVITYTTLLSPFWIRLYYRTWGRSLLETARQTD
jgi:Kef-type K+ transport system membrane component KefB